MVIFAVDHDAGELHLSLSGSDFEVIFEHKCVVIFFIFFFPPDSPFYPSYLSAALSSSCCYAAICFTHGCVDGTIKVMFHVSAFTFHIPAFSQQLYLLFFHHWSLYNLVMFLHGVVLPSEANCAAGL